MSKEKAKPLESKDIRCGRVYSGKRQTTTGFMDPLINDRQILWISSLGDEVQYDSPSVAFGRHRPKISMEKFLKWAKADVTDLCPKDEWRKA